MANNPITMSKIRHILRLHSQGRNKLLIATHTGVSRNTLKKYLKEFENSGLSFKELDALGDKDLEELLMKPHDRPLPPKLQALFSLFPAMDKELKRKGMTRLLLWEAYRGQHPDGYGLSQFKNHFAQWKAQVSPSMHIEHKAGDKLYVDFRREAEYH